MEANLSFTSFYRKAHDCHKNGYRYISTKNCILPQVFLRYTIMISCIKALNPADQVSIWYSNKE